MKKVAIILSQDLLSLKEDHRLLREAKTLINSDYEVTAFCWARGLDKYETPPYSLASLEFLKI